MAERKEKIGGRTIVIRPLNLGQLEKITPLMAGMASGGTAAFTASLDALQIMVSRSEADLDVRELEATPDDIRRVVTAFLESSGYVMKAAPSGEALAGVK